MAKTLAGERGATGREVLMKEAERRVRAGESLNSVARALQVSEMTMSRWAARGGFRLKDLEREAKGEPPLPVPPSMRESYRREDRLIYNRARREDARTARDEAIKRDAAGETDLAEEAAILAREALALVRTGRTKAADAKLRAADRLLRIKRRIGEEAAVDDAARAVTEARDSVFDLSVEGLIDKVREIAEGARGNGD